MYTGSGLELPEALNDEQLQRASASDPAEKGSMAWSGGVTTLRPV